MDNNAVGICLIASFIGGTLCVAIFDPQSLLGHPIHIGFLTGIYILTNTEPDAIVNFYSKFACVCWNLVT